MLEISGSRWSRDPHDAESPAQVAQSARARPW